MAKRELIIKTEKQLDTIHRRLKLESDFTGMFKSKDGKYKGYKQHIANTSGLAMKFIFTQY